MKVVIVDYGLGNLLSVQRAIESTGNQVEVSSNPERINSATHLILPGVGAYADGMQGLEERNLIEPIIEFSKTNRPLLGICLGMQMLFEEAEEFGLHKGLGIIPGRVVKIPNTTTEGLAHKVPHIGWNNLHYPENTAHTCWDDSPLQNTPNQASVYFVHSYTAVPREQKHRLADCHYNGRLILAATRKDSIFGCQFHPEKSAHVGVGILKTFCEL